MGRTKIHGKLNCSLLISDLYYQVLNCSASTQGPDPAFHICLVLGPLHNSPVLAVGSSYFGLDAAPR